MPIRSDVFSRILPGRRTAYVQAFDGPHGKDVLADLASFCRMKDAPFVPGDAMATGVLIGRQEVYNRISRYLHLSDDELWQLIVEGQQQQRGG